MTIFGKLTGSFRGDSRIRTHVTHKLFESLHKMNIISSFFTRMLKKHMKFQFFQQFSKDKTFFLFYKQTAILNVNQRNDNLQRKLVF